VLRSPTLLVVWLATIAVAGCARIGLPWSSGSEGSWIGLCADSLATPTARKRVPVTGDSGKRQALVIGDSAITGCTGTPIALGEHAVLWAGLSSGPNTEGVDLIGRDRNGAFDVDEQISLPAPPEPAEAGGPDPTRWRAFGAESRATATVANGSWSLSCSPGTRPAGAVLRLKDVVRGDTVLRLEYTARGTFELLAADSAMHAAERAVRIGTIDASKTVSWFTLPPAVVSGHGGRAITIACPAVRADIHLARVLPLARRPAVVHGTWFWSSKVWRDDPNQIFDAQQRLGLTTVYVGPPAVDDSSSLQRFDRFVRAARARGLHVWPVLGDPRHATDRGRDNLLREVAALAAYAAKAPNEADVSGLQLDIEPYLIPGTGGSPAAWIKGYRATIEAVRRAWPYSLDVVVPFWWSRPAIWPALQPTFAPMHDVSVTVMDYRTTAREASQRAAPFLAWGAATGHRVHVALEMGPLPDNDYVRYAPAAAGRLWEVPVGTRRALILVDRAGTPTQGRALAEVFRRTISGGATSFRGDWDAFFTVAELVSADFGANPMFGGITVHGVDDPSVGRPTCLACPPAQRRPAQGR
jgi:hypothetical protein